MAEESNPEGRPTKYKTEYNQLAYKYSLLGAIDKDLADFFEVDGATINRWKIEYPEFCVSIKKGKAQADSNVANRLYKRAMGYKCKDIYFSTYEGEVTETPYTKIYPPDPTSAIFWLKNRQPEKWRDRQEIKHDLSDTSLIINIKKSIDDDE